MPKNIDHFLQKNESDLTGIFKAGKRLLLIDHWIAILEKRLESLKAERTKIRQEHLPPLMDEAGITKFEIGNYVFEKDIFFNVSIPTKAQIEKSKNPEKDLKRRADAHDFIRKNGGAELIQNTITVAFPKGKDKDADRVAKGLQKAKIKFDREDAVHGSSLKKFIREAYKSGLDIPDETFDFFSGDIVRVDTIAHGDE